MKPIKPISVTFGRCKAIIYSEGGIEYHYRHPNPKIGWILDNEGDSNPILEAVVEAARKRFLEVIP